MNKKVLLQPQDWNFDAVPPEELRACLIWECARECNDLVLAEWVSDLRDLTQPTRLDRKTQKEVINSTSERKAAAVQLKELNFDLDAHLRRLLRCHEAYTGFYDLALEQARSHSAPWQLLKGGFRKHAVAQLGKSDVIKPLQTATIGQLEVLWKSNAEALVAIEDGKRRAVRCEIAEELRFGFADSVEITPDEGDPKTRELTCALTVNFSLYSNQEIVEAFALWLKEARLCPPPMRRGKKLNDDRAALDGIGMMRALHRCPFGTADFPAPFTKRGSRACYKGRRLALAKYHECLPFVPQESFPESWVTAAKGKTMASKST